MLPQAERPLNSKKENVERTFASMSMVVVGFHWKHPASASASASASPLLLQQLPPAVFALSTQGFHAINFSWATPSVLSCPVCPGGLMAGKASSLGVPWLWLRRGSIVHGVISSVYAMLGLKGRAEAEAGIHSRKHG